MNENVIRLSLVRQEVSVVLAKADGTEVKWTLRELDGRERNSYLNKMTSRVKVGKDGKAIGISSFDGFQADLLRLSLVDEHGEHVTEQVIEGLPSAAQLILFKRAQQISGLQGNEEEGENPNA